MSKSQEIRELLLKEPGLSSREAARRVGCSRSTVQDVQRKLRTGAPPSPTSPAEKEPVSVDTLRKLLGAGLHTPASLKEALNCSQDEFESALEKLQETHVVHWQGSFLTLKAPEFGSLPLDFSNDGDWVTVGLVADTHLACKEERLESLHNQYDVFKAEGITTVLHAGNPVEGYIPRINGGSVLCTGIDAQALYFVDNYPSRPGMVTYFITGDDHEGWWQKEGFSYGAYQQMVAEREGRVDLKYIGHVESDVQVQTKSGVFWIKVQHPGGGSSYARSYVGQKQVEAFQGGEKPHILVQGHYHMHNYMVERNVHVINLPGFQDQTIFARKKRLRMEVGGAILSFRPSEAGSLQRVRIEWNLYFDRKFYTPYLRSDSRLIKGKLVLDNGKGTVRQNPGKPPGPARARFGKLGAGEGLPHSGEETSRPDAGVPARRRRKARRSG